MDNQDNENNNSFPSELRMDIANRDWVVIATGRAKKPEMFRKKEKRKQAPKRDCPFCNIESQERPTLIFEKGKKVDLISKNWTTIVFPNKYPAFIPNDSLNERFEGSLYQVMNAVGFHELVATKDHNKQIANFTKEEARELFSAYCQRYLDLKDKRFVNSISIFHNHGPFAGASVCHPHSQIITTPLIDSDIKKALEISESYFKNNSKCLYCQMSEFEMKEKKRIVYENDDFIAICPFASKMAFEVIVSPKKHFSYFEKITEEEKTSLADIFQIVMKKIYKGLDDPDYNFYLHTAPTDGQNYDYYHWHWTILPKTSTWAGFEIGTRIEISTIEPEKAAEYLRNQ